MAVPCLILYCTAYERMGSGGNTRGRDDLLSVCQCPEWTGERLTAPPMEWERTARQLNLFRSEGSEVRRRDEKRGVLEAVPIKLTASRESSKDGIWLSRCKAVPSDKMLESYDRKGDRIKGYSKKKQDRMHNNNSQVQSRRHSTAIKLVPHREAVHSQPSARESSPTRRVGVVTVFPVKYRKLAAFLGWRGDPDQPGPGNAEMAVL
ncbi:hypothetical protein DFH94DRAFT_848730 [Russula ochroleuca]|uniref:Uncharacterized protein n=1 Tax=Russula ochroleuca TaxID=152965 RepID=A0A9P5MNH6_9AGAM|nr:hypothetical protein DFH94DRAFT_848730 [Russula ochroleuca]